LIRDKDLGVRLAAASALKKAKGPVMRQRKDGRCVAPPTDQ
jgi:hypothetical protein